MLQAGTTNGFTIIEVLGAIAIAGIIISAFVMFQGDTFVRSRQLKDNLEATQSVRITLKRMVREIRPAARAENGAYAIEEATKDSFTFYSDIDRDGVRERVRYFLDSGSLKKVITDAVGNPAVYDPDTTATSTAVQNVVNANDEVFQYYNKDYPDVTGDPISDPVPVEDVRLVAITLSVDVNPAASPEIISSKSQVSIRNLKDNY